MSNGKYEEHVKIYADGFKIAGLGVVFQAVALEINIQMTKSLCKDLTVWGRNKSNWKCTRMNIEN